MRSTNAVARNKKTKKILKHTKGFYGRRKNCKRIAKQAMRKSLKNSYIGRKIQTRNLKTAAIQRINAFARYNNTTYSKIIGEIIKNGLTRHTFAHILGFIEENGFQIPSLSDLLSKGLKKI